MAAIKLPSQDYLRQRFDYDPQTGRLVWRDWPGQRNGWAGRTAGTSRNYSRVRVDGTDFKTHRVVWKLMTGNDPGEYIDHINHDRTDNRWCNLRLATHQQNEWNKADKTGSRGIHFMPRKRLP